MARMRSMKPEYFSDQEIAEELPGRDGRDARLLYPGLWCLADEHGRLRADPRWIKGQLFAYDDDLTPEIIDRLIDMIAATGRAVRYRVRSSRYLFLPKLGKHQRLEADKVPSRLPGIDEGEMEESPKPAPASMSEYDASEAENRATLPERDASLSPLKHVAGSREHVASSRGQHAGAAARDEPPPDAGPPSRSEQILAEWANTLKRPPQKRIANAIGVIVQAALAEGQDAGDVREGLRRWQAKGNLGPAVLPSIIHEVANGPRPGNAIALSRASPNDTDRSTKGRAFDRGQALAAQLRAEEEAARGT